MSANVTPPCFFGAWHQKLGGNLLRNCRYELTSQLDTTIREAVYDELRSFNQTANPVFWARVAEPANAPLPLIIIAFDAEGAVAGGLLGETQFSWFKLAVMAVRAELRGCGIGTELVRRAEAEAERRGCKYAYVDTMSYQAPGFYRRLGYQVVGELHDWDSCGHAKYHLMKALSPEATA